MTPHYVQTAGEPAVAGTGPGVFGCPCGETPLISGYAPGQFLGVAIQCGACGQVSETPGVLEGTAPPRQAVVVERGQDNPPRSIAATAALIGKDEMDRLIALYLPREPEDPFFDLDHALLDGLEADQLRLTGRPFETLNPTYKTHPLAWALSHFRARLGDPGWRNFHGESDAVALAVLGAFREMISSWGHHPLFRAMVGTAAARDFSFHAMAIFGAAKALAVAGNRIGFVATEAKDPRIAAVRLVVDGQSDMSISVVRFDQFEWPDASPATPASARAAILDAMSAARGHINRLHPGILILSAGAVDGAMDSILLEAMTDAIASHGKRHRGLMAIGAILPKVVVATDFPRRGRFGFTFLPVANQPRAPGGSVQS